MGIELPADLADLAGRTGVRWPAADEDKMREVAQAWRDTGQKITALVSEADTTARSALSTTEGASADAARDHWGAYVQPDTGHLTKLAKGCTANADKLEHAADQIGAAKLAIVRELAPLAKNVNVAEHAARTGDPTALLGLDTAIRGASANLAGVHSTLVTAVQPLSGTSMDQVEPIVNTHPGGGHGPAAPGLLDGLGKAALGAPGGVVAPVVDGVAGAAHGAAGALHGAAGAVDGLADVARGTAPVVDGVAGVAHGAAGALPPVVAGLADHGGPGGGHGHGPGIVGGAVDAVSPVLGGGHGPGGAPPIVDGVPGHGPDPGGHLPGLPGAGAGHGEPGGRGVGVTPPWAPDPETGPLPSLGDTPTPPSGLQRPDHGVHVAGAAAVLDAPPPPAQAPQAAAQPLPGQQIPGQQAPSGVPAQPAPAGPFASGGGSTASPAPPPAGHQAGVPAQHQAPRASALPPPQVAVSAEPVRHHAPPQPVQAPVAVPTKAEQDRDAVIALWLVRMFPLGHMPVVSARPARQLPPPPAEFDYAAGMRFEPDDHPRSDLVDDTDAWERAEPVVSGPPVPADDVTLDHDPLAGQNERDWARRFVVRDGTGRDTMDTEYAWPPSELFPEGATAPGEPEVLEPGAVIDRFGSPEGRVFAAAATPFVHRSLPPSHVTAEYRRYRVLRHLPVWHGISAAWFGQPGGGVRYRTTRSALDLVALGYLAEEQYEGTGDEG